MTVEALEIDNLNFFDEDIEEVIEKKKQEEESKEFESKDKEEEAPFKDSKPPETPDEEEEDDDDKISVFTAIVKGLNSKGVTSLPEDVEYTEDTFLSAIFDEAKESVREELGLDNERTQAAIRFISNGGELAKLADFYRDNAPSELDVTIEENAERVVTEEYTKKGLKPKTIATLIQGLKDDGELESEAQTLLDSQNKDFKKREEAFVAQQEQANREKEKNAKEYEKTFNTVLNSSTSLMGLELNTEKRKKLKEWLNSPVEHKHTDGKTYKLTRSQIKQLELQNDPKRHAEFSLAIQLLMMEGIKQVDEEVVKKKAAKSLWDKIDTGTRKKNNNSTTREAIDEQF